MDNHRTIGQKTTQELKEFYGGLNSVEVGTKIRNHARYSNSDIKDSPCQVCGYALYTELCHIKDIQDFDENTPIATINDKNNIAVLCRNCHWEFDNGYLEINGIQKEKVIEKPEKIYTCSECNIVITKSSKTGLCSSCYSKTQRKVSRPSKEDLLKDLETMTYIAVGRKYGVSNTAIRKWLK